ncbi:TonB-dependent receptor domain-containing protein [Sphingomonas sp. MMS24-JH45]
MPARCWTARRCSRATIPIIPKPTTTSISVGGLAGYFYYQDNAGNTIDPRQRVIGRDHFKKLSQELRVASPADEPFRIVAGGFYQRQSNLIFQDYRIANLGTDLSVNGYPGTLWLTRQHRVDKDYAMFGEASLDLMLRLTLTAAAAFIYDNSLVGFFGFGPRIPASHPADGRPFTAGPFNAAGSGMMVAGCYLAGGGTLRDAFLNGGTSGNFLTSRRRYPLRQPGRNRRGRIRPKSAQGQGVTDRFNATWKPVDDVLLYATWSRGFRPGGINRRGDVPDYGADFLTNYELGGRRRWRAGCWLQRRGVPAELGPVPVLFLGENSFTVIQNGPDARIRGIEADANLTTGGLSLTASGSYTDAKTRTDLCAQLVCDGTGTTSSPPAARACRSRHGSRRAEPRAPPCRCSARRRGRGWSRTRAAAVRSARRQGGGDRTDQGLYQREPGDLARTCRTIRSRCSCGICGTSAARSRASSNAVKRRPSRPYIVLITPTDDRGARRASFRTGERPAARMGAGRPAKRQPRGLYHSSPSPRRKPGSSWETLVISVARPHRTLPT